MRSGTDAAAFPPRHRARDVRTRAADAKWLRHLRRTFRSAAAPPRPWQYGRFGRSVLVAPARVENPDCLFVGDGVVVHEHSWFSIVKHFPDIVPRVEIGDRVRIGRCCQFSIAGELVIEDDAIIGDFVQVGDTFHPWEVEDRMPELTRPVPVRIGRGAIVASHAIVLPGVTIGEGSYVEHHSIVQRDVAPGGRVAGRPAKPVPVPAEA